MSSINQITIQKGFKGKEVSWLHNNLNKVGYNIYKKEYEASYYGYDTISKVKMFQARNTLEQTGIVDPATRAALIAEVNNGARYLLPTIKGRVSTVAHTPAVGYTVRLFQKTLREKIELEIAVTDDAGNYQITYDPPAGKLNLSFEIESPENVKYIPKVVFRPGIDAFQNFVFGGAKYIGPSEYEVWLKKIEAVSGSSDITGFQESGDFKDVTYTAGATTLSVQKVMYIVLAQLIEKEKKLPAPIAFAFFRKNLPADMPKNLLDATAAFTKIEALYERLFYKILSLPLNIKRQTISGALSKNRIPYDKSLSGYDQQVDAAIEEMENLRFAEALNIPFLAGGITLKPAMDIAEIPSNKRLNIANYMLSYEKPLESIWSDESFIDLLGDQLNVLKNTLDVGSFCKNHSNMWKAMYSRMSTEDRRVRDYVQYTIDHWIQFVTEVHSANPPAFPPNINSEQLTDTQKIALYANDIYTRFQRIFSSYSLVNKVNDNTSIDLPNKAEALDFFNQHPDFDLRKNNINAFIKEGNLSVADETVNTLKVMQRLTRISSNSDFIQKMIEDGVKSSYAIYKIGKKSFMNTYALPSGASPEEGKYLKSEVEKVYNAAEQAYANTLILYSTLNAQFNSVMPAALGDFINSAVDNVSEQLADFPDLNTLFGNQDYCRCSECQSIYGAAAYLVDTLQFLKERSALSLFNARNILFSRRNDISKIHLNCTNTNTVLPYIDIVNEILENVISGANMEFQTTGLAEDLRAHPEHEIALAYNKIMDIAQSPGRIPLNAPFHLWNAVGNAYLGHFNIKREDLIEGFRKYLNPGNIAATNDNITKYAAATSLSLSQQEYDILINTSNTATLQKKLWGVSNITQLNNLATFLEKSGLNYEEVELLIAQSYIYGSSPITISSDNTCDSTLRTINTIASSVTDIVVCSRMMQFIRLWRKLGWKMEEVNAVIKSATAGGNGTIDTLFINKLQQFIKLKDKYKMGVEECLAFFENINVAGENSLYSKLFLNKSVANPPLSQLSIVNVSNVNTTNYIDQLLPVDNKSPVMAALNLREADLWAILKKIQPPAPPINETASALVESFRTTSTVINNYTPKHKLTLSNLSGLYRYKKLSKLLKTDVASLLMYMNQSSSGNPFSNPADTLIFMEQYQLVNKSGLSIPEIDHILRYNTASPYFLSDAITAEILRSVREKAAKVRDEVNTISGSYLDAVTIRLRTVQPDELIIADALNIILNEGVNDTDVNNFIDDNAYLFTNIVIAKQQLSTTPSGIELVEDRAKFVLTNVADIEVKRVIAEIISSKFSLTPETADYFLNNYYLSGETRNYKQILLDENLTSRTINQDFTFEINLNNFTKHFKVLRSLHKIGTLKKKLKLSDDFLLGIASTSLQTSLSLLHLNDLPDAFNEVAGMSGLHNLIELQKLYKAYPKQDEVSIITIYNKLLQGALTKNDLLYQISFITGWDLQLLLDADVLFAFNLTDYLSITHFKFLKQLFN